MAVKSWSVNKRWIVDFALLEDGHLKLGFKIVYKLWSLSRLKMMVCGVQHITWIFSI